MALPSLSRLARAVLLAPSPLARAAAVAAEDPEQRWMLLQSRDVRRSFVEHVVDRPEDPDAEQRWMLLQPDPVRRSYVREVLDAR